MNEQDMTSSDAPATPGTDAKKQPASGAVIENRPVQAGTDEATKSSDPKPAVESTLVGKPEGASPAAQKRGTVASPIPAVASKPEAMSKPEPKAETRPEPATRTVETRVEVRKGGFMPTFIGGVVAAGLGAAACYWAIPQLPPEWRPGAVEAVSPDAQLGAARDAGTEAARTEIAAQADALGTRAAEAGADAARQALADRAPDAPAGVPSDVNDKLAALERAVADLSARASQQPAPAGNDGAAASLVPAAPPAGPSMAEITALTQRLDQQQARIDELAARPTVDPATADQVQALASQAAELQKTTEDANRRAQAATAASALQAAIENAAPRDQALADLTAAGVQVPEVLTGDIPRLDQLRAEFPTAARDALRAATEAAPVDGGVMTAVGDFLRVQTGARSVEPREGSDPDAVLSRADAAVEAGNIVGAATEIAALPQVAQDAMAPWTARAKIWIDANAALSALASGSR